jgi:hypothetical protein
MVRSLKVHAANGSKAELVALSIREPCVEFSGNLKVYPVLGARGLLHDGDTRLGPGGGSSGMAYYVYECYGGAAWDPAVKDGVIRVRLMAEEVFGGKASCEIDCREKSLAEMEKLVPGISTTGLENSV